MGPRNADATATSVRLSRGILWVAAAQTGAPDIKDRLPAMCRALFHDILMLWITAEEKHKDRRLERMVANC